MFLRFPNDHNAVANANGEDGFLPLPMRRETTQHNGQTVDSIVTCWEPSKHELTKLNNGGLIELSLMCPQPIGQLLSVVMPKDHPNDSSSVIHGLALAINEAIEHYEVIASHEQTLDSQESPLYNAHNLRQTMFILTALEHIARVYEDMVNDKGPSADKHNDSSSVGTADSSGTAAPLPAVYGESRDFDDPAG